MLLLPNTPLRRKLRLLIAVPGTVVFFVVGVAVLVYEAQASRETLIQRTREALILVTQDAVEGANLGTLETFPLRPLRLLPGFQGVVVWDAQRRRATGLTPSGESLPPPTAPRPEEHFGDRLESNRLLVWRDFFDRGKNKAGTVGVVMDLTGSQERLWYQGQALLALTLLVGVGLWVLAGGVEGSVSQPLLALRELQEAVRAGGGLGLRAAIETDDETARAVEGYHHLLARLEETESALRRSREREQEAQRVKGLYLAGVGHELRTPLMSILSYAEALEGAPGVADDVEHLRTAGRHLLQLIDQILDLSRLEAGRVELELAEVPVVQLVQEVTATVEPLVERRGNTLTAHLVGGRDGVVLGTLRADLTRCRQILLNLLSNAAQFTRDGRIDLKVWREVGPRCDRLFFQVTDEGAGITPQQMEGLFEPFARLGECNEGAGLGLALSRRFARLMGGDISVTSEPGAGSTFTLRLPVEVLPAGEEDRRLFYDTQEWAAVTSGGRERPPALVLDDDPDSGEVLETMLGREGFTVHRGATGDEALALARRLKPALILLAVKVPPQRGWTLLARLKAEPELAEVPVIVVSPLDERNKALDLGAGELLVKPFDRKRLAAAIERCRDGGAPMALVVQDDPAARQMLRRTLERAGWQVVEADHGVSALRSVSEHGPKFIVLDLMLSEMDGFSFLRELRKIPEGRAIAVLVVTGRPLSPEEENNLGPVVGVLEKGVWTLEEFRQEVHNLARSQLSRD